MKLREGAAGRRGPQAAEMLTHEQPAVEFDLLLPKRLVA